MLRLAIGLPPPSSPRLTVERDLRVAMADGAALLASTTEDDPYWAARRYDAGVEDVEAPVVLIAGWHDLLTPWQLDDYVRLRRAGRTARLVIGPWTHVSEGMWSTATRESIRWLRGYLLDGPVPRAHVRVYVSGAREWRDLRDWPPPEAREHRLFLQPGGGLEPGRFDVFARVYDIDRWRVSRNVCDALQRITPESADRSADGTVRAEFDLWPSAHRFERGHRIRLQISSGAHPRYARNPGTGEPLATATRLAVADQEVCHEPALPSALVLSVVLAAT